MAEWLEREPLDKVRCVQSQIEPYLRLKIVAVYWSLLPLGINKNGTETDCPGVSLQCRDEALEMCYSLQITHV